MEYQLLTSELPTENLLPVEQVFANRGFNPEAIEHYLNTTREDIYDPKLLDNIEQGAQMLIKHLGKGDKIFIQIDPDVDGYTSSAFLINYLNRLLPGRTQQKIIYRIQDGKQHGILAENVPEDVGLVVIPDAGSNDIEQHRLLYERGIDVIVIDHHEVSEISPYAITINNQLGNYPNKTLSGVGVVYKFCSYIDSIIGQYLADDFLDLVAIGMVSDMMDLRDFETKELISLGTAVMKNPFLKAFVEDQQYSLKGEVTPFGISFYIAPYINATIRVGTYDEKLLLFESLLEFRALEQIPSTKRGAKGTFETRVEQACRTCKNIKNRQNKTRDTSIELIENIIQENNLLDDPVLIIQLDSPVEENLTGLIANQIMGKYMRPVLLLNRTIEVDESTGEVLSITWRGSGRNATYSKLENFREFLANSGLVEFAQGHASAFGVAILDEKLPELKEYLKNQLKDFDFSNFYRVDFIWESNKLDSKTILDIGELKSIWGQGLAEPQVAIENITITSNNLTLMSPDKKPTLKITLQGNINLIKFDSSIEEYENLKSDTGCKVINIVGTCNENIWNNNISPQILIKDYEIIKVYPYYF